MASASAPATTSRAFNQYLDSTSATRALEGAPLLYSHRSPDPKFHDQWARWNAVLQSIQKHEDYRADGNRNNRAVLLKLAQFAESEMAVFNTLQWKYGVRKPLLERVGEALENIGRLSSEHLYH